MSLLIVLPICLVIFSALLAAALTEAAVSPAPVESEPNRNEAPTTVVAPLPESAAYCHGYFIPFC